MKDKIRKAISIPVIVLIVFSFMTAAFETHASGANAMDNIIEGKVDEITKSHIIVNNLRFDFCTGITFYSETRKLSFEDMAAAAEVELYEGNRCVNKIVVLKFAQ